MSESEFERVEIRLNRPLCEHLPTIKQQTWYWYFSVTLANGERRQELHMVCKVCKRRLVIPRSKYNLLFTINGEPALVETPAVAPEPTANTIPIKREPDVTFEREFTRFDRKWCELYGIKYEGP